MIVQPVYYQGYKLDEPVNGNPILSREKRFFSPPEYPNHLWNSTSLQCYGYHKVIPQGYSRWGVKLTTHFYLVARLRMSGVMSTILHMPSRRAQRQISLSLYKYKAARLI
jgi:hypothetical protein